MAGDGCVERVQFECNYPGSPDQPFGRWVVSICPAKCDKTRAMCFCGEGTKYPDRPLAETCGFQFMYVKSFSNMKFGWLILSYVPINLYS